MLVPEVPELEVGVVVVPEAELELALDPDGPESTTDESPPASAPWPLEVTDPPQAATQAATPSHTP